MNFVPESPPTFDPVLAEYLSRLEQRISNAFTVKDDLEKQTVSPSKTTVGMIRYADGVAWDPGAGEGMYGYLPAGWIHLSGGAIWGQVKGTLADQTDLQTALDGKATTAQGALADSAIQPGDNISELVNNVPYLVTETDPVFVASAAYAITLTQITNWDTAYGWGDHSAVGYLTAETNNLAAAVTWTTVPDAYIAQSSVTQHQAALSITESQISDLGTYLKNLVEDITPQLGGDLDTNGNDINADANINITDGTLTIDQTGTGGTTVAAVELIDSGDDTRSNYTTGYIRINGDFLQVGVRDASHTAQQALHVVLDDTYGIGTTILRCNGTNGTVKCNLSGIGDPWKAEATEGGMVEFMNAIKLPPLSSAPSSPSSGWLAVSDGTGSGFDGSSGAGLYRYNGSAWVFIG